MKRFIFFSGPLLAGFAFGWLIAPEGDREIAGRRPTPSEGRLSDGGAMRASNRTKPVRSGSEIEGLLAVPLDSAEDCKGALDAAKALRGREHPLLLAAVRDRALRRWLELDAESVLAFAEGEVRADYEPGVASDLFRVWLDLDVDSALESFALASPSLVRATRGEFFANLAQIDPQRAAWELADPRWEGTRSSWDDTAQRVFAIWAAKDPRAAAEAAMEWKIPEDRSPTFGVAAVWAEKDPAAAWAFYKERNPEDVEDRFSDSQIRQLVAGYLLEWDPVADIGEMSDYEKEELALVWARRNPESAMEFAEARPDGDVLARALMTHASEQWATAEPDRALDGFLRRDGSSRDYENRGVLYQAFASLAASGLESSMERWATLPDAYKSDALSGILTYQFAVDQGTAMARWREWLDDPEIGPSVLPAMGIALSWGHGGGAQDLGEVLKVIPEFGESVRAYFLEGWVKTDPEEAAGFIAERVLANDGADIGDDAAVAELAFSRPDFTARWLPGLPEGTFRNDAAAALAINWAHFNPAAAAAWVNGLPEGEMKESARSALEGTE